MSRKIAFKANLSLKQAEFLNIFTCRMLWLTSTGRTCPINFFNPRGRGWLWSGDGVFFFFFFFSVLEHPTLFGFISRARAYCASGRCG